MHIFKAMHGLLENKKFGHHPQAMGYGCANFHISTICCGSAWRRMFSF